MAEETHLCNKGIVRHETGEAWDNEDLGLSFWKTWDAYWCSICGEHQGEGNHQTHHTALGQI